MQNVSNLVIPEGEVRTVHDKDSRLLWGRVSYSVKYSGDTAQGGTPTPDSPVSVQTVTGEQTVTVTGKNLWDPNNVLDGVGLNSDGTTYAGSIRSTLDYTIVSASQSYVITGATVKQVCFYDASKTYVGRAPSSSLTSFTTTAGTKYIRASFDNTVSYSDAQLEQASAAAPYESYQSQSYAISLGTTELCKIDDYQDYIYKNGNDWFVHKDCGKIVFDGSDDETWSIVKSGTANFFYAYNSIPNYLYTGLALGFICSAGVGASVGSSTTANGVSITNVAEFRIRYGTEMTLENWKSYLSSTPMSVYYRLTTPTDTKITDNTLISQLDAIHQFLTRYGYNATVSGDLPLIIDKTNL